MSVERPMRPQDRPNQSKPKAREVIGAGLFGLGFVVGGPMSTIGLLLTLQGEIPINPWLIAPIFAAGVAIATAGSILGDFREEPIGSGEPRATDIIADFSKTWHPFG